MLQGIRDRAQGWLAWIVVIFISIPFALWGIQQYFGTDPNVPVAEVNGVTLNIHQFQRAYQQHRERLRQALGGAFDLNALDDDQLKRSALDGLVGEELLLQMGAKDGLTISDEQLARAIHAQQVFQIDGAFSQDLYQQWLQSQGYSPGAFEYEYRRSLLREQIAAAVSGTAIATEHELKSAYQLSRQKRIYSLIRIPLDRFENAEVGEDVIADYYEKNKDRFVTPEEVNLAYIELSMDTLAAAVSVDEGQIQQAYEDRKSGYMVREQRRASHILVAVAEDADDAAVSAARARIEELHARIDAGESFASVAEQHSDDAGSAALGGDLGFFSRGIMDRRFEDMAFSMQVGQVSAPVRSSFGFHLIKLTQIQAGSVKSLAEVRDQILAEFRRDAAQRVFFEQAEQLANLAFEHPDNLDVAAQTLGLEIRETGFFGRGGGQGRAGHRKVIDAAFSDEILREGNNSDLIELEDDQIMVVRVKEHHPSAQRSLDSVRAEVVEAIRRELASEHVRQLGVELISQLRDGDDPKQVAERHELAWSQGKEATRDSISDDENVIDALFKMGRPSPGNPLYGGVQTRSDDYVVIALDEVIDGDFKELEEQIRRTARTNLAREFGREDLDSLMSSLRSTASIDIREENL